MVIAQMLTRAFARALSYDVRLTWTAVLLACAVTFACDRAALLAPTNSTITLNAATRIVPLGGQSELTATVLENSGSPVPNGTTVRFTTSLGRVEPAEAQTRNGIATAMFVAGMESGTAQVRAISGLASGGTSTGTGTGGTGGTGGTATPSTAANVVDITVGAAAARSVTLSANPSTVRPSGSTADITALVRDTNGNALPNVPVIFSTTRGIISPTVANTDAAGAAKATLSASETATVTASVTGATGGGTGATGGTSGVSATIEVRASTVASFTLAVEPTNPSAGQPVRLTITPSAATGPAPRVSVNWGDGSVQDIGTVAAARSVTHTYGAPGFFTISATGTSPDGDEFSNAIPVTVAQQPPVQVTANPTSAPVGTPFTFTITPTTGALIQEIKINYGDGTEDNLGAISTQTTRQHTYSGPIGSRTVTVTQTETNGRVTIATITITLT